jgi:multiple sugar transport system permease protein
MSLQMTSPSDRTGKIVANGVLILIAIIFLLPLLWMILAAFNPDAGFAVSWPKNFSVSNFGNVLNGTLTYHPLINGLIISGFTALIVAVFAALCSYPLSRYRLKFGQSFLYTILFGASLPVTAIVIPVYSLFVNIHLIDSITGVILFEAAGALPYSIWLTKNFMDGVPIEIEEAAWVDGASAMAALRRVVVPLVIPGLLAMFVFTFIESWGNFFAPFILLLSSSKDPISVSIYSFFGLHGQVIYGELAAYSIIYTTPIIILYLLVQRVLSAGFRLEGGLKG